MTDVRAVFYYNKKQTNKMWNPETSHKSEGDIDDFDASKGTEAHVTKNGHVVLEVFSPETT